MCSVSMIGDEWSKRIPDTNPWVKPIIEPPPWTRPNTPIQPGIVITPVVSPTKEEFEALKREVEALKDLLKAAKIYDERTGQADCEMDEKIALIKKIADYVGVNLDDVFGPKK